MSNHPRRFWEAHGGARTPLPVLLDHVQAHGSDLAPEEVIRLAAEARVPEPTVRGALTYYADLGLPTETARVCDGTSCRLAGAADLRRELEAEGPVHPVYCLGYCHASPAALKGGRVRAGVGSTADSLPEIRLLCDEPLVTRRLVEGGAPSLRAPDMSL